MDGVVALALAVAVGWAAIAWLGRHGKDATLGGESIGWVYMGKKRNAPRTGPGVEELTDEIPEEFL